MSEEKEQRMFEARVRLGAFKGTKFRVLTVTYQDPVFGMLNGGDETRREAHIAKITTRIANGVLCQGSIFGASKAVEENWLAGAAICWKCWKIAKTLPGLKGICFD